MVLWGPRRDFTGPKKRIARMNDLTAGKNVAQIFSAKKDTGPYVATQYGHGFTVSAKQAEAGRREMERIRRWVDAANKRLDEHGSGGCK